MMFFAFFFPVFAADCIVKFPTQQESLFYMPRKNWCVKFLSRFGKTGITGKIPVMLWHF
jgi:hypothetical protein